MSQETIIPFDENLLRLPTCLTLHTQLRPQLRQLTSAGYASFIQELCQTNQTRICGIIGKNQSETIILALAVYRIHPTTFDTIRFELHDLIVDEKERNHGLGTSILQYLINQAKQYGAPSLVLQCDLTNTDAHRFFFRHGFIISSFGFCSNQVHLSSGNDRINVIDITDLPEDENKQLLIQAQEVFRQLRPNLPSDEKAFIDQIRNICRTGPARVIAAISNDEKKDILGLATYRISHNIKYAKHIYCDDLISDENKRSLGVGQALMNHMKKEAAKLGLHRIALDSGCQRGRAHKFYHREGLHIDQFEFTILF